MATLSRIAVCPIAPLDPVAIDQVPLTDAGRLTADHAYTIVDEAGEPVDAGRTAAVHALRATVDLKTGNVVVRVDERALDGGDGPPGERVSPGSFHLEDDRDALEDWLSTYFGTEVHLRSSADTDRETTSGDGSRGPTLVARATLREVGSWYDLTAAEMRMRIRPNLVVAGVPPFWEDRLVAGGGRQIRIGSVILEGETIVPRSAVPARDPYTGDALPDFRETFVERRRETLPDWADPTAFGDDYYRLAVLMHVPESERDGELRAGDTVELLDGDA